jgi:hypothetical protein
MSDESQTSLAPEESRELRLLSFISGHFGVFSLLGLLLAVLCSTLFLYGYLSVFDWQLIWIIEYPDILKFGLVALAVISGIIFTINALIANAISATRFGRGKQRAAAVGVIIAITLVVWAIPVVIEWRTEAKPRYDMYLSFGASALFLIALSLGLWDAVERRHTISAERMIFVVIFLFVSVGVFGGTFGTYAKYSKGLTHDVFLKDREMSNVRLVLFTSHHTVLYAGTDAIVLPTSEIMKIVAHPPTAQQRWP